MLMMISKVLVFSVLSLGVIVGGVEHGKTSAVIAAKGEVELEDSETSQKKPMVRQAPHSRKAMVEIGHDGSLSTSGTTSGEDAFFYVYAGCHTNDPTISLKKCLRAGATRGTVGANPKPKKLGFRCCTAPHAESKKVKMTEYGCIKRKTCNKCKGKTHQAAAHHCAQYPKQIQGQEAVQPMVLCDIEDLHADLECKTGCRLDKKPVWTSNTCTRQEYEADALLVETEEDDGGDEDGDDEDDESAATN